MTRILVLGATGLTGTQIVRQALAKGLEVTALVRDPRRLEAKPALRVIAGDTVRDPESLHTAVSGQDAVVSALGVGKSFSPNGLIERSMRHLVAAMEAERVKRLVFVSAFGVGETWRDTPLVPRLFIRTLLRRVYEDKRAGEAILRRSGLEWTLVCPTGLTTKPGVRPNYRYGERLDLRGFPTVSREDVADFVLRQLTDRTFLHKEVLVST
jgi:uncharacterized protein YbjT (DUF2867 family)